MTTGFVCDERFFWHDTGTSAGWLPAGEWLEPHTHVETSASKRRIRNLLDVSGLIQQLTPIPARPAELSELHAAHDESYVSRMAAQNLTGGDMGDGGSPFGPGGYDIARLAAGGVIEAVQQVVRRDVDNAYCLVRPSGHHAGRSGGEGFCMFNNVAIAALASLRTAGVERVAIVDWDAHHGNGTQEIFWNDPRVLTISLHQDGVFPLRSGAIEESGSPEAPLSAINVPFPGGSGTGAYEYAFDHVVAPALRQFSPDLILVASGFDANGFDPMARLDLHSESYRSLTRHILLLAEELCGGRALFVHEGGYSEFYVPFCALTVLEELSGVRTAVVDPYLDGFLARTGQELLNHQRAVIDEVADHHLLVTLENAIL